MSEHIDFAILEHLAYNVFLLPKLLQVEQEESFQRSVDLAIVNSVTQAGQEFSARSGGNSQWSHIDLMLKRLYKYVEVPLEKVQLCEDIQGMKLEDVLAFYIQAQNAGLIIRRQVNHTTFEVFEVQAQTGDVMSVPGKIVRHFPGPVVQVPNPIATDSNFIKEIANILARMNTEVLHEAQPKTQKAGTEVRESRDSINPNYFIQYFLGFLRGMGTVVYPLRIVKRLADEVLWMDAENPWRRSPIWLIIRVALQTSIDSQISYKHFMAYYHASLVSQCCKHESFPSDLLYAMRVKMARRLCKFKGTVPQFLIDEVKAAASGTQDLLQGRWDTIQSAQSQSPNQDFSGVDFKSATNHLLPNSREYLEEVFKGRTGHAKCSAFTPNHSPRLENIAEFSLYANGNLTQAFEKDPHLALFDLEASVFEKLTSWTSDQRDYSGACAIMSSCFRQYLNAAKTYYVADMADQSTMVLTLARIWMAIDQLATRDCSLLCQFSPELPDGILDPLLLRTAQHIEQARIIQQYICGRRSGASLSNPSIFSDGATHDCFAVRYFSSSPDHKKLKMEIEAYAQEKKDEKLKELEEVNAKHEHLSGEIQNMAHEYYDTPCGPRQHSEFCGRCFAEQERKGLQVQPYEWPLPRQQLDAEAVVFELKRPGSFTIWRDITYEILVDLGTSSPREKCNPYATLNGKGALSSWLSTPGPISPRITIASVTKAFGGSHYKSIKNFPASEHEVCLHNALQFKLYDQNGEAWAAGPFPDTTFARYGTLKLPPGSLYRHLEYSVEKTTHTSNDILADQYNCPQGLSLHEHIAFGTLRSGARLQWMNIVRGLEENLLTFSSDEVRLLHTQAAWQIGPLSDDSSREWHEELDRREFGHLLILQCGRALNRVKANWLQANTVLTIVTLVNRLLASSPPIEVTQPACDFLREARAVADEWLGKLEAKLQKASREDIIDYQYRVCEVAAICRATYDVEPGYINRLLSTADDYSILIKASISLHDNQPPDIQNAPTSLQTILCRDRRFAHKIAPHMLASALREDENLSSPLSKIWPGSEQGTTGWQVLEVPNRRWITTTAPGAKDHPKREGHFNLLTGQLLINGQPLGRLPRKYVEHATYIRLFGQRILGVEPAESLGMQFTTRDFINGFKISFILEEDDGQLIIQARKGDRIYELVPHTKLCDDFPLFFSRDYHHWADIESKTIQFRPISSPWPDDACQWLLCFDDPQETALENSTGGTRIIDIHSPAFKSLSRSISPLESDRYLHITHSADGLVEVELPRMKFSFFINGDNQLESRNFRGQVLDENQSAGTLLGLKNQLLLRAKGDIAQSLPCSRSVLIPDGEIGFTTHGHHVSVSIMFDSRRDVDVYRYKINEDLGYLATDAGLTSRLFKIYLHALTSHCLPDPLTGRTGTEEALHELSQASTSSFEQIDIKQAGLLKAIGSLTPKREYYPKDPQCMQKTHWINLPSLSQHFAFSSAASAVLRRAATLHLFHPLDFKLEEYITAPETSGTLLKRAARRTAMYYPPDTTGYTTQIIDSTAVLDSVCPGRDSLSGEWEEAGQAASWASGLAYQNWGKPTFESYNLVALTESWGTLHDVGGQNTLSYRSSWFGVRLDSSWISIYNLLRRAESSSNRYMLSAFLASVAFGKDLPENLILVFLAFATNPKFRTLDPPSEKIYHFEDAYKPTRARIQNIVSGATFSVRSSPAGNMAQNRGESYRGFCARKERYHIERTSECQSQLVKSLMSQWSCEPQQSSIQLHSPSPDHSEWLNVEHCLKSTREYFSSCVKNIRMRDHLRKLQEALASRTSSLAKTVTYKGQEHADPVITPQLFSEPWDMFSTRNLMRSRPAPDRTDIFLLSKFMISGCREPTTDTSHLIDLLDEFRQSEIPFRKQYGADLDESREELEAKPSVSLRRQISPDTLKTLDQAWEQCKSHLDDTFQQFSSALSPSTPIEQIVFLSGIWPRVTSRILLQKLSLQNRPQLDSLPKWRNGLIEYAQVFAHYQRAQRLSALANSNNTEDFYKELDLASSQVDPGIDDPDWLLVQIDGNFGARAVQRHVAHEMISPSSESNTVLQLNMGEGKSSVIVPIIASSLADSSRLVRVVVLKPLWRQMFELLVSRLSGLANRRIYYMPFGRHIGIDDSDIQTLRGLYEECMREGGILVAQPEHILSFKLMGIDRLICSNSPSDNPSDSPSDCSGGSSRDSSNHFLVANALRGLQDWLQTHTRDILDESDEILHVRYQLVYTIGKQQPLDDHPDRWITTQQLLHLAAVRVKELQLEHPDSLSHDLKYEDRGQFPVLRILPDCQAEIEQKLISRIAEDVLDGRLSNLGCDRLPVAVRDALQDFKFFTKRELPYLEYEYLKHDCNPTIWKGLLLVRGLLASGILVFALKSKHHRVDYGLDLGRSLLAVPYRAKDIPSLRAEFGHPDVAVVLTCLSYYYQGLTDQQLDICFKILFKLDNPALEYEQWVKRNNGIPEELRDLNGINMKDQEQFTRKLVPAFSHNSATIDFFLSSVVFPKAAKEFPGKLATSGWDLAERKHHVTTGFSGTNDNRYLLPTSITQADPVKQLSTNALVLTYLLQPGDNTYICMRNQQGGNLDTKGFLELLGAQTPEIRVLLDVGAQMLELRNEELVRCWLDLREDIEAAVYFNDRDELMVLPRDRIPVLLSASPFAQNLDKCIVYLDDGHTRGTDLKLPRKTRALVTLGPKITKDRLLQGEQ
ncbi:hypothetical protein FRC11_001144 [Ceratobasidium sp. 423]|nr:hypothetical protein FRC11_001144 [Ceratobasidium sp. 423]